jgi:type IV secretory pathway VirB10-like protein
MLPGLVIAVLVLSALALYWWWQSRPLDPGRLHRRAALPQLMQLRRSTVFVVVALLLLLCLGVAYLVRSTIQARSAKKTGPLPTAPAPAMKPASPSFLQRFPKTYEPPPPEPPPEPPPRGVPVPRAEPPRPQPAIGPTPAQAQTPALTQADVDAAIAKALAAQEEAHQRALREALAQQARSQVAAQPAQAPPAPATPKEKLKGWDEPDEAASQPASGNAREGGRGGRSSALFPPATWERPAKPEYVLYASQLIHCLLEQAVVTGESSTVRCRVTETVYDKFGQLQPLIPMDSIVMATAEGTVRRGQNRVRMKVDKVELPDGTDLGMAAKVGDAAGAVGVKGKVDNKYGQVILATLISAGLSVGARVAGGNSDSYQPTIQQEFGREASQGFNQAGQRIVNEAINIQPVISLEAQTPVTIQLDKNISLQTRPVIVHK